MNPYLARIQELLNDKPGLSQEEKDALLKALSEADKQWAIVDFKLDRTEKVKKTAAILLEETIAELELKRKAVEDQNRELAVEGALERVRTIAMAMQQPEDMLKICRSITQELQHLGLKEIRNVQTVIINAEKGTYLNYEYFDRTDKEVITSVIYNEHEVIRAFVQKVLSDPEAFFSTILEGEDLQSWIAYQRSSGQYVDPHSEQASSIHYYFFSIGEGALGISTYAALQDPEIELFKRFRNVFALAYKRFTDIETAQAQAREAQIQLGLERVRAKTMAMQMQGDLFDVVNAFGEQLVGLGLRVDYVSFINGTISKDRDWDIWGCNPNLKLPPEKNYIPYKETAYFSKTAESVERYEKTGYPIQVKTFTKEEKDEFFDHYFLFAAPVPDDFKQYLYDAPGGIIVDAFLSEVTVSLCKYELEAYTLEQLDIFKRFSVEFRQAYIRFLDLQKAEAQAREAQIEAALEKVRARSLAMQKPEEIKQVAELLRSEMAALGVEELETSSIYIPRDDHGQYECWYAIKDVRGSNAPLISDEMTLDLRDTWVGREMLQFAGSAEEKTSVLMKGEQRIEWINYCSQRSKVLEGYYGDEIPERTYHLFKFAYGYLGAASPGDISAESWSLLKRASAVFSFAYTRFLDLQDAAARAREAQIQLGLERVRSRSMAMHRSGELVEVARTLFDQMAALGFVIDGALILLFNREERSMQLWIATTQLPEPVRVQLPYDETIQDNQVMKDIWQSFESGTHLYNKAYSGDTKNNYFRYVSQHNPFNKEVESFQLAAESWVLHLATTPHALIGIDSWQGRMITEQEFDTIIRFSLVFEQAYIRFLDLQKAEAQAREAQIEAALERIRSRSLAMHHSSELSAVVDTLLREFTNLEFTLTFCIINLINEEDRSNTVWAANPETGKPPESYYMKFEDYPFHHAMWDAWKAQKKDFIYTIEGEEKKIYDEYLYTKTEFRRFPKHVQDANKSLKRYVAGFTFFKYSGLQTVSENHISHEDIAILERFGRVFEQSYTRFLDLQRAEEQTREAEIQLALERVRARAMAMHTSEELKEVVHELRKQMGILGQKNLETCVIHLYDESPEFIEAWVSIDPPDSDGETLETTTNIPRNGLLIIEEVLSAYAANRQEYVIRNEGEKLKQWFAFLEKASPESFTKITEPVQGNMDSLVGYWSFADFTGGSLLMVTRDEPEEPTRQLLRRFSQVFGLAYRRFSDLKQAEARAREAKIEAALERVRSRTMAMQKSDELPEAAILLFNQLQQLGMPAWSAGYCTWNDEQKNSVTLWMSSEGILQPPFTAPTADDDLFVEMRKGAEAGKALHVVDMGGDELVRHYQYMRTLPVVGKILDSIVDAGHPLPAYQIMHQAYFSKGFLLFITYQPVPEAHDLFKRFAAVFDQTYTRFLDLQKAETQAREAQVEAALERVRTKSLAMTRADELFVSAEQISKELTALDISAATVSYALVSSDKTSADYYNTNPVDGSIVPFAFHLPHTETALMKELLQQWQLQQPFTVFELDRQETIAHQTYVGQLAEKQIQNSGLAVNFSMESFLESSPQTAVLYAFHFAQGFIFMVREERLSADQEKVVLRFAKVFEQTYTRFLDLQRAEAQAREAMIEAALERVRSKAMAMHNSEDLQAAASTIFSELQKLGIKTIRAGISIQTRENRKNFLYTSTATGTDAQLSLLGWAILDNHPVLSEIYDSWMRGEDYFPVLKGDLLTSYYREIAGKFDVPAQQQQDYVQYGYFLYFTHGMFYGWAEEPFSEDVKKQLKRFASVVDLTFKRYYDLQKAEANAKEALKQASLDRVRAEIASMRSIDDLQRITPLIWEELNALSISFTRCGVFIMDDALSQIHTFLSTPDGKAIASFNLDYSNTENIRDVVRHWQQKQNYVRKWGREEFASLAETLFQQGSVRTREQYLDSLPGDGLYLHFLPFNQGMLYVGNTVELKPDEINLVGSLAEAFSTAYARYEDFSKLEAAKQQVDKALVDLKQAQQQLVQSEKMASLGELTAGIAHEIQNPLNFVNNFSEVSHELVSEMKLAMADGDQQTVSDILEDLAANLEKINHHGKRADSIVKGMLQHSRSSTGTKEPTDVNNLCDEFLRLAYHGLRAKDKDFNTKVETAFEQDLPKVSLMSQDVGRVLLNLVNNAFYAVNEKKKAESKIAGSTYAPQVTIATKNLGNRIQISVQDNGNGIPEAIRDKIFQPFFTTKPTGQGTGLGLSLSYDIVTKGHGGTLQAEPVPGGGEKFVVTLPL